MKDQKYQLVCKIIRQNVGTDEEADICGVLPGTIEGLLAERNLLK